MILYFAPLACSLASRIALYEADIPAAFQEVVLSTKQLKAGGDYLPINAKGQVPALALDDGQVITEGPAVLQFIADQAPDSGLAPPAGSLARTELQGWLNMLASELHSNFVAFMHPASPPAAKDFARMRITPRLDLLEQHLAGRETLMDGFTVADAYLVTILGWSEHCQFDLAQWPALAAYRARMRARPAVARALGEELALRAAA
ncbi:MAG: glutathione S-transferase [Alphaproteobacteria bacterium PA4]|nr:MAG: glutathione S-transferase [Alphaproteobacteria bacterium PA4]